MQFGYDERGQWIAPSAKDNATDTLDANRTTPRTARAFLAAEEVENVNPDLLGILVRWPALPPFEPTFR